MDASPSELKIKKRKRRAVLSCNDCRRRKLKCDRELPCNRCINGGIANACAYGHENDSTLADVLTSNAARETTETSLKVTEPPVMKNSLTEKLTKSPVQPSATASDNLREEYIERLERRVASLEAHLATLTGVTGSQPLLSKVQQADPAARESTSQLLSLFKGEGFRTFAYGPTSPITIVVHVSFVELLQIIITDPCQFPQLRPFMKEVYPDSTLERVQEEVKVLEDRARSSKISKTVLSVPYLRSLLPERGTVDVLIRQYLDTFETTYRIVHIPSFLAEYQNFWGSQPIPDSDFEALVLAILACVLCTSTHEATRHNPNGSTFRSKAIIWVKACEAWLKRQSNKHRTLASIQIRCLRLLALKTTCLKTKEFYQETQAHMAYMRTIGMHRDPSILQSKLRTRCSAFEGEMRRRLWATSLELELQASIDRGTPSVLSGLEYDCSPPQNIHDSDLLVDMDQLPSAQPISTFTDTSFLHFSMQTAPLRTTLCAMTNRLHSGPDSQEVSGYEAKIQEALEKLPKWPESKSFQAWTHLDLQLRQFLVILHTHRALQAQFRMKPDHRYSILTCLEAAITLIERHMDLVNSGNYVLCCIRSDYYRAALILCHITWHASNDSGNRDFIPFYVATDSC